MNKTAIILETMSFFLVTFDLYNQSKPNETRKKILTKFSYLEILTQLSHLVRLLVLPFIIVAIIGVILITINLVFAPDYHLFDLEKFLDVIIFFGKYFLIIVFPLFATIFIINSLATYYEEKHKPIFILIGCVLFVISKSLSFFSE